LSGRPLDVPQEDLFRRVKGLWEDVSSDHREGLWKYGRSLLAKQWKEENKPAPRLPLEPVAKRKRRRARQAR
jgi:hypothetical protein